MQPYKDPVAEKYIELFKAKNSAVKSYFYGEPFQIHASKVPALYVSKRNTEVRPITNSEDEYSMEFRLTLVTDVRQDWRDEQDIVEGITKLYDILEGRDNGTYKLKEESLLNILRTNIEVDVGNNLRTDLSTITRVDYTDTINQRSQGWFIEGYIDFTSHYIQNR